MSALGEEIAKRTGGMHDRKLFVAFSKLTGKKDALAPHLDAHLKFMIALEEEGVLFGSGPFYEHGIGTGEGMTIVRAESLDAARAILSRDPFVVSGVRTFDLYEWHLMEGAIHVTLFASQRRGALP